MIKGKTDVSVTFTSSMNKTTLKDLALALNLSCSAVSSALNGRSNIPAATQERVRKMAVEMGYRPDARVTQLMSYLRTGKGSRNAPNLAWLCWDIIGGDAETKPWLKGFLNGARNRADELGYAIDLICFTSSQFPPHRLNSIFAARGIEGIILSHPCWPSPLDTNLKWSNFALAELEGMEGAPGMAHVGSHGTKCLQTVFSNFVRLGYRRPGFIVSEWVNQANGSQWTAGFLQNQRQLTAEDRIPILESDDWSGLLAEWMQTHQPDVIVCVNNEIIDQIKSLGYRVPEEVAVVHLNLRSDVNGWAGIDQRHEDIGAAAVDVVTAQLNRGERGLSKFPKYIYISGKWVDGWTCPPRTLQ